jgi:curved DNA-binding protein CbpA
MDCFAVLQQPRRPWLDPDALKQDFLRLSSEAHPDRFHSASEAEKAEAARRAADLNAAYQTLREPRTRLIHLIELETGSRPSDIQRIPPGTMDLFVEVGQTCRDVDGFLAKRREAASPMLKVRMFEEGMEWVDRLNGLQQKVWARGGELDEELKTMNAAWDAAPPADSPGRAQALPLGRLEEIYRLASYVGRWTEQIQERLAQLREM